MEKIEFKQEKKPIVNIVHSGERDKIKLAFIMDFDAFELDLKECYELQKFLKRVLP